ncbi:MAG TPA: hypothetical protein VK019_07310 [Pseudomonas sp.]|nr:hypothetical protein [Pseudomonas sp.]
MGIVSLIFFTWLVHQYHRPLAMAGLYTALVSLFSLFGGAELSETLIAALVTFLYMAGFFWVLDRYSHTMLTWVSLVFAGTLIWFGGGVWLA